MLFSREFTLLLAAAALSAAAPVAEPKAEAAPADCTARSFPFVIELSRVCLITNPSWRRWLRKLWSLRSIHCVPFFFYAYAYPNSYQLWVTLRTTLSSKRLIIWLDGSYGSYGTYKREAEAAPAPAPAPIPEAKAEAAPADC